MMFSKESKFNLYIFSIIIVFIFTSLLGIQYFGQYGTATVHNNNNQHVSNRDQQNQVQQPQTHTPSLNSPSDIPTKLQSESKIIVSPTSSSSSDNPKITSAIISNVSTNPNKVVIITFGDGYQSQYTLAKPILDKYGYKGNFFITCNRVGTPTKMTWPELVQLYKSGNVIGSKTIDYGTKAMENKDLNHLSPQELEFEVGQSKQCLMDHGISTTFFAVPKNLANNNATVINTIAKYYTLAINGHSNLMYLDCSGGIQNSAQTDCRTYFGNGNLTPENRYSVGEWSMQHLGHGNSFNDTQMFGKFIEELNSQNKFNKNGVINAIPLIGYHDIVTYPDAKYSNVSSDTTLNLFNAEIKYIHDNGFKVLTFYNLGYDDKNNLFFIKQ